MNTKTVKCLDCSGTGRVLAQKFGLLVRKYHACPTCKGTGTVKL
ncbi:molecular chaperone DnaJ [Nocardiopsis sp. FR4]|nr:molecular chaperone DnaJ [Nocardiopsis sp. FR4]